MDPHCLNPCYSRITSTLFFHCWQPSPHHEVNTSLRMEPAEREAEAGNRALATPSDTWVQPCLKPACPCPAQYDELIVLRSVFLDAVNTGALEIQTWVFSRLVHVVKKSAHGSQHMCSQSEHMVKFCDQKKNSWSRECPCSIQCPLHTKPPNPPTQESVFAVAGTHPPPSMCFCLQKSEPERSSLPALSSNWHSGVPCRIRLKRPSWASGWSLPWLLPLPCAASHPSLFPWKHFLHTSTTCKSSSLCRTWLKRAAANRRRQVGSEHPAQPGAGVPAGHLSQPVLSISLRRQHTTTRALASLLSPAAPKQGMSCLWDTHQPQWPPGPSWLPVQGKDSHVPWVAQACSVSSQLWTWPLGLPAPCLWTPPLIKLAFVLPHCLWNLQQSAAQLPWFTDPEL